VRVCDGLTGDDLLIDLWRVEDGGGTSWTLQFSDMPDVAED
jgi:hypothetical protein